jgi:hypothetical protein
MKIKIIVVIFAAIMFVSFVIFKGIKNREEGRAQKKRQQAEYIKNVPREERLRLEKLQYCMELSLDASNTIDKQGYIIFEGQKVSDSNMVIGAECRELLRQWYQSLKSK